MPAKVEAQFTYLIDNGTVTITGYTGPGGDLVIPGVIDGFPVTGIGNSAFDSNSSLSSVSIPEGVISIGDHAFANCFTMNTVSIPKSVTSIGLQAFILCSNLTAVFFEGNAPTAASPLFNDYSPAIMYYPLGATGWTQTFAERPTRLWDVPSGLAYLKLNGQIMITKYDGARNRDTVAIPSAIEGVPVTSIGDYAFFYCQTLTSITIPDSVTAIGVSAIASCRNLTNVIFGSGVKQIGNGAFGECGFASLTIPDTVVSIGDQAFAGCHNLTSLTIGKGVVSMGSSAVFQCWNLRDVFFRGNAPESDASIFTNDTLATIYHAAGTTGWGSTYGGRPTVSWEPQSQLTYTNDNGQITITGYLGSSGIASIPALIDGVPVARIAREAFAYRNDVISIAIPSRVTTIGDFGSDAFLGCSSLRAITVDASNSLYSSLDGVLFNKSQSKFIQFPKGRIGTYNIPGTVTEIGDSAFDTCSGLTNVVISNGVVSLGNSAFNGCWGLRTVTLPNSLAKIGTRAFAGCTALAEVLIGSGLRSIGDEAFTQCSALASIIIPDSVTSIGQAAFTSCESLASAALGQGLLTIGENAFSDCASLTEIAIPRNVASIGAHAFYYCASLEKIQVDTLNSAYRSVDGVLFDKTHSTLLQCPEKKAGTIAIPDGIASIEDSAFYNCASLTNITFPNTLTTIGDSAFAYCTGLTSVTYPESVTSIGPSAFLNCFKLTTVYFEGNAPTADTSVFRLITGRFWGFNVYTLAIAFYLPGTTGWSSIFAGIPAVPSHPSILTSEVPFTPYQPGFRPIGGQFGFAIAGTSNLVVVVETGEDLAHPVWTPVGTNILTGGHSYFNDPDWANHPNRFYRLRSP